MLEVLNTGGFAALSKDDRIVAIGKMQRFLVDRVREYHGRQRLKVDYDPRRSSLQVIRDLLVRAREVGKEGPVAQYLVGAKLQMRFPEINIGNESYSTADVQLNRQGDFHLGNTILHVTVVPMAAVYEKCKRNLEEGYRVYLLVPDRMLAGARDMAETVAPGGVSVVSIESFVGQNIDEMSAFSQPKFGDQFRRLIEIYNSRVSVSETDQSMMIEMSPNLR